MALVPAGALLCDQGDLQTVRRPLVERRLLRKNDVTPFTAELVEGAPKTEGNSASWAVHLSQEGAALFAGSAAALPPELGALLRPPCSCQFVPGLRPSDIACIVRQNDPTRFTNMSFYR